MVTRHGGAPGIAELREVVAAVPDPELPMLTLDDLGILRDVRRGSSGTVTVTITPTYSGCPALDAMGADIRARLAEHGETDVAVRTELSPPWSTDWISADGRRKLAAHGIAPPPEPGTGGTTYVPLSVRCPNCGSLETRELSRFGSTACKALRVCVGCAEPFDHVKPL